MIRALLHGLSGLTPKSVILIAPASLITLRFDQAGGSARLELIN